MSHRSSQFCCSWTSFGLQVCIQRSAKHITVSTAKNRLRTDSCVNGNSDSWFSCIFIYFSPPAITNRFPSCIWNALLHRHLAAAVVTQPSVISNRRLDFERTGPPEIKYLFPPWLIGAKAWIRGSSGNQSCIYLFIFLAHFILHLFHHPLSLILSSLPVFAHLPL